MERTMAKPSSLPAFFFFFFSGLVAMAAIGAAEEVVSLDPDTFEQYVGKEKAALVEFYAPWCGHCKKLAPEYEKLGAAFKRSKAVVIAKVDCDSHKSVCSKYGVSGYPTIKWFPKGSLDPKDYSGGRTAEALVEFVNKETGTNMKIKEVPSDVVVLTVDNFNTVVLDESKDVLVEFYAPWCGHCKSLAPVYDQVASVFKNDKDVIIAKIDADAHKDIAQKYGVSGYPTLKYFPKNNKNGDDYNSGRDLNSFVAFINEKTGTSRDNRGQLTQEAGKVATLSSLVEEFLGASLENKKAALLKLEEECEKLEGSSASYGKIYTKIAKKSLEKGDDYAKKELERLERLLSGAINPSKADELTLKKNVISLFVK